MAKENKALMRRRKGWIGFVHGYADYVKNVDWDSIKWDKKTKAKSVEKDAMGKEIQKW